jgi:hypothetical protein
MRIERFLYSRSLTQDYRWMIVPKIADGVTLNTLRAFHDAFDRHRTSPAFLSKKVNPMVLARIGGALVLSRFRVTDYRDIAGRAIFGMEGIAVPLVHAYEFRCLLPCLIDRHKEALDSWRALDARKADSLMMSQLPVEEFDAPVTRTAISELLSLGDIPLHDFEPGQVSLTFDEGGLRNLAKYFASPFVPLREFAFGATPEVLALLPSAGIVAPAYATR